MIIILTQCFPSRVGGIESLVSNLALGLAKKEKVIVFADRHHFFYDVIFDNQNKDKILAYSVGKTPFNSSEMYLAVKCKLRARE